MVGEPHQVSLVTENSVPLDMSPVRTTNSPGCQWGLNNRLMIGVYTNVLPCDSLLTTNTTLRQHNRKQKHKRGQRGMKRSGPSPPRMPTAWEPRAESRFQTEEFDAEQSSDLVLTCHINTDSASPKQKAQAASQAPQLVEGLSPAALLGPQQPCHPLNCFGRSVILLFHVFTAE